MVELLDTQAKPSDRRQVTKGVHLPAPMAEGHTCREFGGSRVPLDAWPVFIPVAGQAPENPTTTTLLAAR